MAAPALFDHMWAWILPSLMAIVRALSSTCLAVRLAVAAPLSPKRAAPVDAAASASSLPRTWGLWCCPSARAARSWSTTWDFTLEMVVGPSLRSTKLHNMDQRSPFMPRRAPARRSRPLTT